MTRRSLHVLSAGILSLILSILLSSASARGQEVEAVPEVSVSSAPVDISGAGMVRPSLADSGFWFLSTRHSPQSWNRSCPRFCPGISRYDDCSGFRGSNLNELAAGLEPGVPVCIFVHGSFVDLPSACYESRQVWKWLKSASCGQRMQMIYLNWPSYRPLTPLVAMDVNALGLRAARNGYYLAELLQHLPAECPVSLIGHSHGTRVVAAGLHLLAGGTIQGVCHPFARANGRAIRTVFTASAIDHHWLNPGRKYGRALYSTQCLLNMTNPTDSVLKIYPLRLPLIAKRPLGLTGLTRSDRSQLCGWGNKVVDYNVSRAVGSRHLMPYYFRNCGIAMAMRNYVYFPDLQPHQELQIIDSSASEE